MIEKDFSAKVAPAKRGTARDRLLLAADDLFYRRGIRAVGVDQIAKTADVAKISLYRAFPSKDHLIVGYLVERDAAFWRSWDDAIKGLSAPRERLTAVLDLLRDAVVDPSYRGCPFANFTAEFPEREHEGRKVVAASKQELRRRLFELCRDLNVSAPKSLADGLFLIIEGAFAASQTAKDADPVAGSALIWATNALVSSQQDSV